MASPPALVWGALFTLEPELEPPRAPVNTSSLLLDPDLEETELTSRCNLIHRQEKMLLKKGLKPVATATPVAGLPFWSRSTATSAGFLWHRPAHPLRDLPVHVLANLVRKVLKKHFQLIIESESHLLGRGVGFLLALLLGHLLALLLWDVLAVSVGNLDKNKFQGQGKNMKKQTTTIAIGGIFSPEPVSASGRRDRCRSCSAGRCWAPWCV